MSIVDRRLVCALVFALVPAAGCPTEVDPDGTGEGEGEEDPNAIARLVAIPESLRLIVGEQTTVVIRGVDNEGDLVDVSNRLALVSSDTGVVTVDDTGNVTAIARGDARLIATLDAFSVEVPVLVELPQPPVRLVYTDIAVAAGEAFERVPDTDARGATFSVVPALPEGVTFNTQTGRISGTLNIERAEEVFVVSATNSAGTVQNSVRIAVRCDPDTAVPDRDIDPPDLAHSDENTDGIDGLACGPVFVSPAGNDSASGLQATPLATLGAAIALVERNPLRDIYVAAGTFQGPLTLPDNVGIYGGYDPVTWKNTTAETRIEGGTPAVVVTANVDAILGRVHVVGGDPFFAGTDAIGVLVNGTGSLRVFGGSITAGTGRAGNAGVAGIDGRDGDAGDIAEGTVEACVDVTIGCDTCTEPFFGFGGIGFANAGDGGDGGRPGFDDADGQNGLDGGAGALGGLRGFGGTFTGVTRDGDPGRAGTNASAGADGSGGLPNQPGGNGANGGTGGGGGGGGGGAGGDFTICNEFGGAGGGGGAGGEGGRSGTGGGGGGSSIAVLARPQSAVTLESTTLQAGDGGAGGAGGRGGAGGDGGVGGRGGLARADNSDFRGGNGGGGGAGGVGGRGGHGGGGGGGHSIALVVEGAATVTVDAATDLVPGTAGAGGQGPGLAGQPGTATARQNR